MKISVCIPSYKRPKIKTLKYINFAKVYVSPEDYEEYKKENLKANIIKCEKGIQGNVARVRNYILDKEFEQGVDVVCLMDDDISKMNRFIKSGHNNFGYVREKIKQEDFLEFLWKYSLLCEEFGYKLWGVNCNKDSLSFRHSVPFSTTSVILGPFCCHLKNDIRYDEKLPLKEDYDLCIQHLNKYRGVLRVNSVHYDCLQSKNVGGCANIRNFKREEEQFDLLQKKWGSKIVRVDKTNKGKKKKINIDYNPIIKVPIKGI